MKRKTIVLFLAIACGSLGLLVPEVHANIVIKVRALNPLESEEVASISYPLPEEISPDDIISKNITFSLPHEEEQSKEFNIEYVPEEGRYFIIDEIALGPREVVTLEVHVRDIWSVSQERLDGIKRTVEDLIARFQPAGELSPTEGQEEEPGEAPEVPDETVIELRDEILKQFDEITARQEKSSVLDVGVEKHMEVYYDNMAALAQVEADVAMLRYLLEPQEEEGEGEVEEGEGGGAQQEILGGEETSEDVLEEISEEEVPSVDPADPVSEDGTSEPEGNFAK